MFKLKQETMWPVAWFSNRCDLFTANLGCPAIITTFELVGRYTEINISIFTPILFRWKHLHEEWAVKPWKWRILSAMTVPTHWILLVKIDIFRPQDVHVILVILWTGVSNNWSPQHSQQNWFQAAKCIRRFSSFSHWLEKMKADVSTVQSLRTG
jgi:hypothetical protein